MAVYSGCNAKIIIRENDAGDPPLYVSELNNWSLTYGYTSTDFKPIGAFYPKRGISNAEWSLSLSGYFDHLDAGQNLLNAGSERYFEIHPLGDDNPGAKPSMYGVCFIGGLDSSGATGDMIPLSLNVTGSSTMTSLNTFIGG